MLDILLNPITISVIVMCVLCLCKLNVILSILISAMVAGLAAGMGPGSIMECLIEGLNGNGTNAIAYLLLGTFAAALADTGLAQMLARGILKLMKERKYVLLITMVVCACISGTIVPIHIAYIPILYPPLLAIMNRLKIDRRQAAVATEFGLVGPYITIPIGYGVIFQGIIADNMTLNGMPIELEQVWPYTVILMGGMLVGLLAGCFYYRKPRDYETVENLASAEELQDEEFKLGREHIVSFIAIAAVLFGQLYFDSMPLGALMGLVVMLLGGAIRLKDSDGKVAEGIRLMGTVSFVMFVAGGYANVVRNTGAVDSLIDAAIAILGTSRVALVFVLIFIGLLITMGIGTSFGTIPVIALLYVPLCQKMGLSLGATVCLIACAAALGDAGSPASDSTLGPTAGLNADGQHDHIRDTCVPTFVFYNVPLFIAGFIGGMVL